MLSPHKRLLAFFTTAHVGCIHVTPLYRWEDWGWKRWRVGTWVSASRAGGFPNPLSWPVTPDSFPCFLEACLQFLWVPMFPLNLIYCFKILGAVLGGHANNKLDLGSEGILKFLVTKASLGAFVMLRMTTGHIAKANSSLEWATWKPGLSSSSPLLEGHCPPVIVFGEARPGSTSSIKHTLAMWLGACLCLGSRCYWNIITQRSRWYLWRSNNVALSKREAETMKHLIKYKWDQDHLCCRLGAWLMKMTGLICLAMNSHRAAWSFITSLAASN